MSEPWGHRVVFTTYIPGDAPDGEVLRAAAVIDKVLGADKIQVSISEVEVEPEEE
jgi:hypothetical protein